MSSRANDTSANVDYSAKPNDVQNQTNPYLEQSFSVNFINTRNNNGLTIGTEGQKQRLGNKRSFQELSTSFGDKSKETTPSIFTNRKIVK